MRFIKMHGLGNDYIYINAFAENLPDPAAAAVRLSDRHFGIGGDGLILVAAPEPGVDAHVRMRMFNADGSESEMCGNGVRCVCKLAHDYGLSRANPMRIQTGRGVLTLDYTLDARKLADQITVDMGQPILEAGKIPVNLPGLERVVNHDARNLFAWHGSLMPEGWMESSGLDTGMTCVSMGNPHVVFFCRDVAKVPLERIGPAIECHEIFPRRINVHFVQTQDCGQVIMRTWERGSGITLACGTGASAVCVAGVLTGRTGRQILAHLPGGALTLSWRQSDDHVLMTGPATQVFTGEVEM